MRHDLIRRLAVTFGLGLGLGLSHPALAQSTAPNPSSGQENLPAGVAPDPHRVPFAPQRPGSPVVQSIVGGGAAPLVVRQHTHIHAASHVHHRRHYAGRPVSPDLERPALAGVTLLQPLPVVHQPPHIVVPLPAYPLETVADAFLTPPPPIVCHPTPRIRDLPDPELYRETTLVCEPDNP